MATIIFDFDDTVAVGPGPVLAYAHGVAGIAGSGFLDEVQDALDNLDRSDFQGGYHAVAAHARARGVTNAQLDAAYTRSRTLLGTEAVPVDPAPGLLDLLAALDASVRVELVTNAPETGIHDLFARWGIAERFGRLHFSARKPRGIEPVVRDALEHGPVLSIGDIYDFDLAPAAALGADTALVGTPRPGQQVTFHATTLEALAPDVLAWAGRAATAS